MKVFSDLTRHRGLAVGDQPIKELVHAGPMDVLDWHVSSFGDVEAKHALGIGPPLNLRAEFCVNESCRRQRKRIAGLNGWRSVRGS